MLKFFRKYNKIILVVGACFLMVAFLIQPVLSIFTPDPLSRPIGQIDGQELTVRDQRQATAEMRVLSSLPVVRTLVRQTVGDGGEAPLHWMLLLRDARRIGLSASNQEVEEAVTMLGVSDRQMKQMAKSVGAGSDFVRQAIRHWLIVEQYRNLVGTQAFGGQTTAGLVSTSSPGLIRLRRAGAIMERISQNSDANQMQRRRLLAQAGAMLQWVIHGSQRLSEPVVRAYLQDNRGQIKGQLMTLAAKDRLNEVNQPSEPQLRNLYKQYRDVLPGESEPFGFGYRIPDRVKLEYLKVPIASAQKQVSVDDRTALEFYNQNKSRFVSRDNQTQANDQGPEDGKDGEDGESSKPRQLKYKEVRQKILQGLGQQKASNLVQKVISAAQGLIQDAERSLPEEGQYKRISKDYKPLALEKVVEQLRQRFDVKIALRQHTADWVGVDELSSLQGIGRSMLGGGRNRKRFAQYVQTVRELKPQGNSQLMAYRLQTGLVSQPLRGFDGSGYLFRVTDAQQAHNPESLDAVRAEVVQDAKLRAAYQKLLDQQESLRQRIVEQGLESVAKARGVEPRSFGPVSRRQSGGRGGVSVPYVQGIGRSQPFVDTLFEQAGVLIGQGQIKNDPVAKRLVSVGLDQKLSLAVARIDSYQPLTRSQFQAESNRPLSNAQISRQLQSETRSQPTPNPLSLEALKRRTHFVSSEDRNQDLKPAQAGTQ